MDTQTRKLRLMKYLALTLALMTCAGVASGAATNWLATLQKQLPLLGHRNWIVIADAAYPWQTAP